jgi:hypothetical protein
MPERSVRELQRLFTDLDHARHGQYKVQLKYLHRLLAHAPIFRSLLDHLQAIDPSFDANAWITKHLVEAKKANHIWPDDEAQKMKVLWRALERLATDDQEHPVAWGSHLSYRTNFDESVAIVTDEIVRPLVNYLLGTIGTESATLHHLERFKRQVEWFEQETLFAEFTRDTGHGEEIYDRRLRQFLFAEGIDFPFSKPRSASGEADVIAEVDGDDPLVCEIKLFDGDSYGIGYLAKGMRQVTRYAHDYGKAVGHLVIVNVSERRLSLPSDAATDVAPPRIVVEGVTVFMVVVHGRPRPSASKERKVEVVRIERDQLVTEVTG